MTPRALADYRAKLPDCDLAVFADIASGTVLGAAGAVRYPQEYLDALCRCAADVFGAGDALGDGGIEQVLFLSTTGGRAFFRSRAEPGEALCCICAPDVDVARLLAESEAALSGDEAST